MRIVHVINSLEPSGAETVLLRLLNGSDRSEFDARVVSLTGLGPIALDLERIDVPSRGLGLRRGAPIPNPFRILELARIFSRARADIVQTWMYHSNLIGGLAAALAGRPPVIWGVRQTNLDRQSVPARTAFVARLGGWMSARVAARILYNSETSRRAHVAIGYHDRRAQVIPNGFDTSVFRPDTAARAGLRKELGVAADAILVGLVARYDPQKDHGNFVDAAARVHRLHSGVHFVLAGLGVDDHNADLARRLGSAGVGGACHLLGHRTDIPRLAAAFDVGCLSSMGESLPNAVGEIMSCGVPCAVTDVGDASILVGDCGRVVPPRDPAALAGAMSELIVLDAPARKQLGARARKRIQDTFGIGRMVERYEAVWREVALDRSRGSGT